jgi:lysine 2,3-aminomutase
MHADNVQTHSWKELYRDGLKSIDDLKNFFGLDFPTTPYPIFIPKSFAQKIKDQGLNGVLAKQFLPRKEENQSLGLLDPIGDKVHQKTSNLIFRYDKRLLFFPTQKCPINCRYCFRKNEIFDDEGSLFKNELKISLEYISEHSEIEEVIFSGGDPLVLSDEKLAFYLEKLSTFPHIKFIRFHTRMPVIMAERLDGSFISLMKFYATKFKKIVLALHLNHADEWDHELASRLELLQHKNIEVLSQTVLLKGINDSVQDLEKLFHLLSQNGVRPYYLHHPDLARGTDHFYVSLDIGRQIYNELHHRLSGWMLPHYMIDLPGGHGKTLAFNSESQAFSGQFLNRYGELIDYPRQIH